MQDHRDHRSFQAGGTLDGQIDRPRGFCLDPVAEPTQRAVRRNDRADASADRSESRVTPRTLDDGLDFSPVLVMVKERRKRDGRFAWLPVAQDHQPGRRDPLRQHLAAQHRHERDRAQQVRQGGEDGLAGGGHWHRNIEKLPRHGLRSAF
jgi:hypothetical protein